MKLVMNSRGCFFFIFFVSIISSCQVENFPGPIPESGPITFYASSGDAQNTKTTLLSDGSINWLPSDMITVFYKESRSAFTSSNQVSSSAVEFTGELEGYVYDPSCYFWAVYPDKTDNSFDGNSLTVSLPSKQQTSEGSFADDLFISIARTNNTSLYFYNVCGGVRFSVVSEGVHAVSLEGNKGEVLAGTVRVGFSESGKPEVLDIVDPSTRIVLSAKEGETLEPGKWYYITTLPVHLTAGYTLTMRKSDGTEAVKKSDKEVIINRSVWGSLDRSDRNLEYAYRVAPVCLDWSYSQSDVQKWMGEIGLSDSDEEYMLFGDSKTKQYVAYDFAGGKLIASALLYPVLEEEIVYDCFLSSMMFLGELEGAEIYIDEATRVVAHRWKICEGDPTMGAVAFTPVDSDYYGTVPFVEVTTLEAEEVTSNSLVMRGSVTGQPVSGVEIGFQWFDSASPSVIAILEPYISHDPVPNPSVFASTKNGLQSKTTYRYRAYARIGEVFFYGDIVSVQTLPKPREIAGHAWVDLGLPSGLLWSECNLGAEKRESKGDEYAWAATQTFFSAGYGDNAQGYTKYTSKDQKQTLEPADDAASVNWGGGWRMPTQSELDELMSCCDWEWGTSGDQEGYWVKSVSTGESLFLPACYRTQDGASYYSYYWSSSIMKITTGEIAWKYVAMLAFHNYSGSTEVRCTGSAARNEFWPIRPVLDP